MIKKEHKVSNVARDSIILTVVRCVTLLTSMIQTMLLSRIMTLTEYGVYSQLLLVISIVTTFSGLGLNNAINYFYNKENSENKKKYINQIFSMTIIVGIIAAILTFLFRNAISSYYKSSLISGLIMYIAFRPLFANVISLYQSLYISVGRAKIIAARNFIISFVQAVSIPISFYITKDIRIVLIIQIILDILQIIYFGFDFNKKVLKIKLNILDFNIVRKVLKYAIPLGLALMLGTLFKEADKLVIARLMDESWLAVYTNMSKQLPFEFIATSFTAVVTPVIVRLLNKDKDKVTKLWSSYLQFGYVTTWILCAGAIICSKELLIFLYSDAYLIGLPVFVVYLFLEMFKFTYFGIILSATGRTKYILVSSTLSLIANIVFNIVFYNLFGFIGPAIASLLCVIIMGSFQLIKSCKILNENIFKVLNIKEMILTLIKIFIVAIFVYLIKLLIITYISNTTMVLIIVYVLFVSICILIFKNKIISLLKGLKED